MSILRSIALVAGVTLGAIGLAITFIPGLNVEFQVASIFIAAIALLALLFALYDIVLRSGTTRQRERLHLPTPERRSYRTAGEEIDRQLASLSMLDRREPDPSALRTATHSRLEHAAIDVLTRHGGVTEEQAREYLTQGSWTDDPHAAAFFAEDLVPTLSTRDQLRTLRTSEPTIRHRSRHTIAALAQRLDDDSAGTSTTADSTHQSDLEEVSVQPLPAIDGRATTDDDDDTSPTFPEVGEAVDRWTGRWQGMSALALLTGAMGMVLRRPSLLLASVIGVACAAYARTARPPIPDLEIERAVSETRPSIDEEIEVEVTVRNTGEALLPDCSLIDGVPSGLVVTDGSPRHGTALRPGKATVFSYTVTAVRGEHSFDPALVIARDLSASVERLTRIAASEQTTITCVPLLQPLAETALRAWADRFGGRVTTDTGGTGVEFYATREYRRSDPRSRIDWNRFAKTGELSTLVLREERATTVMLVIDARPEAYLALNSDADSPADTHSAVERSIEAAGQLFAALLEHDIPVGLAALSFGPEPCWLAPGVGDTHQAYGRRLLATHPALASSPFQKSTRNRPDATDSFAQVRRRLPSDAQVVVLTALCDDPIANWIRRLEAEGHAATVISPDPTTLDTPGRQLAHIERRNRLTVLRRTDIPILDWDQVRGESLAVALRRWEAQHPTSVRRRKVTQGM